jgi:hypothetical protein
LGEAKIPLRQEGNDKLQGKWWMDAFFRSSQRFAKSHRRVMSLDGGAILGTSTQQKLNTKSSTEAELAAVSNVLPQIMDTIFP